MFSSFMNLVNEVENTFQTLPTLIGKKGKQKVFCDIDKSFSTLEIIRNTFDKDEENKAKNIFQEKVLPIANESKFCRHILDKPYGYAGDFMAMEMIHDSVVNKVKNISGTSSKHGDIIDSYNMQTSNSLANYYRVFFLLNKIKEIANCGEPVNITSIGCGPSLEIREFKKKNPTRKANFFLIDLEKRAIEFSKKKLKENDDKGITFLQKNVLKLALRNNVKELIGEQDFIYSSGLYDYLSVRSAKKLTEALFRAVKPGGRLLITNAHPSNPSKFWMEFGGDWYLDYKTKEDMYRIVEGLDDVTQTKYHFDDFSVYQYIEVYKSETPLEDEM